LPRVSDKAFADVNINSVWRNDLRANHQSGHPSVFAIISLFAQVIEISSAPRQDPLPARDLPQGDADECRALMRAVLESRTFAKSTRLAQFLKFICTRTIEGNAAEINEQQIGIHVFARSPMYSASDDSIVRTQARLLRQRLEEYFEHEAPDTSLIIAIPKGGYVPIFQPRTLRTASSLTVPTQVHVEETATVLEPLNDVGKRSPEATFRFLSRRLKILITALGAVLVLVIVAYFLQPYRGSRSASDTLWSAIFKQGWPVVIVPSDDALVLFEEETKTPVQLNEYLSGSYLEKPGADQPGAENAKASGPKSEKPSRLPFTSDWFAAHQYTSTADLNLVLRLGRLPAAHNTSVETRNARVLRIDDLKSRNVILIGGLGANPWIGLFSNRLNFEVNYDWKNSEGYVLNKHPAQGESPIYRDKVIDGIRHSYGVLAFLPGIEDEGEALLFEGTGMAGTESASDFPFNSATFDAFGHQIGATPQHMPYFEALLETTSVGGNAPEVHVLTYHRIQP
jgi:hypothetical protein